MAPAVSVDLEPSKSTVNGTRPDPPSEPSTAWGSLCTPEPRRRHSPLRCWPVLVSPCQLEGLAATPRPPLGRRCDLSQPAGIRLPLKSGVPSPKLRSHETSDPCDGALSLPSKVTLNGARPEPALTPRRATGGADGGLSAVTVAWLLVLPEPSFTVRVAVKVPRRGVHVGSGRRSSLPATLLIR